MKKLVTNIQGVKEKTVHIYKDKEGFYYYLQGKVDDKYIMSVSSVDDAFDYVQRKNNGKI